METDAWIMCSTLAKRLTQTEWNSDLSTPPLTHIHTYHQPLVQLPRISLLKCACWLLSRSTGNGAICFQQSSTLFVTVILRQDIWTAKMHSRSTWVIELFIAPAPALTHALTQIAVRTVTHSHPIKPPLVRVSKNLKDFNGRLSFHLICLEEDREAAQ